MSDLKITELPKIQDVPLDATSTFKPTGTAGVSEFPAMTDKKEPVGSFSSELKGDIYTSRGRFGNGTNYVDISATAMKSANFVSGSAGWQIEYNGDCEFNEGTFRGDVEVGSLHIPDQTTASSFHTDSDGNSWWGATTIGSAVAKVLNTGAATFTDITLTGLQAGSSIDGTYIDALAVSKLSAGTISSKAITLAVAAGTGDSYISGGAGLDYANWTADNGFILGIDDSDSDTAKFFVGDDANDKYLKFDGTNTDATGLRYLEKFTAGETITKGQPLCLGHGGSYDHATQEAATEATYISSQYPTTNYHDSTTFRVGMERPVSTTYYYWGLIDFTLDDFSNNFIDGRVYLNCTTSNVNAAGNLTLTAYPITESWDETTVTWNTVPTIGSGLGNFSLSNGGAVTYHYMDVTDWIIKAKAGAEDFYGFLIKGVQANSDQGFTIVQSETGSAVPGMRGRRLIDTDKVYRAKSAIIAESAGGSQEYRCYNFIGFAAENGTASNPIKVQTHGVVNGLSEIVAGQKYYISNSVGQLSTIAGLTSNFPVYQVAIGTSTTSVLIEKGEMSYGLGIEPPTASTELYVTTYFSPSSMVLNNASVGDGIWENQKQYCRDYSDGSIKEDYLLYENINKVSMLYNLAGGLVLSIPSNYSVLGKIKG